LEYFYKGVMHRGKDLPSNTLIVLFDAQRLFNVIEVRGPYQKKKGKNQVSYPPRKK
jgi:hypothetical protein